jgi:hypothetical protein
MEWHMRKAEGGSGSGKLIAKKIYFSFLNIYGTEDFLSATMGKEIILAHHSPTLLPPIAYTCC